MQENELQLEDTPFVFVDSRKYVLAEDQAVVKPDELPEKYRNLPPAPRNISLSVRFYLCLSGSSGLFGWTFACFGMIFVCLLMPPGDAWVEWTHLRFTPCGQGEFIQQEDTGFKVDYQQVWKMTFKHENQTKVCFGRYSERKQGDAVPVEKCGDAVRIQGTSLTKMGSAGIIVYLFPAIGLCFVAVSVFLNWKILHLLQYGMLTYGKLLAAVPTGMKVNNVPMMKWKFRYESDGGEVNEAFVKHLDTEVQPYNLILYDPVIPSKIELVDFLPAGIRYDEQASNFYVNPLRLVLPVLFAAVFIGECIYALQ